MKEYLFSYGTLQYEDTQLKLFGRILTGSTDILQGYNLVKIEITDESFLSSGEEKYQHTISISNSKNDSIQGIIFEITEQELLACDKYEPDNYRRKKLTFTSGKEAWVYIAG